MGGTAIVVALPIVQTVTTVEVALDRPPQPVGLLTGHGTVSQGTGSNSQSNQETDTRRECTANRQGPDSLQ